METGIDLAAASAFVATHGRVLDRRRLERVALGAEPAAVLAALDGYRNPDGGYGWGLEPDLRSPESQPVGAMHAFEVLAEVAPTTTTRAVELCDWLAATSLPDGGLPFVLPIADGSGNSPVWAEPDTPVSSLQITAQVAANAHLVGRHHPGVARHPWLVGATEWCLAAIGGLDTEAHAYELLFAIQFLDAVAEDEPEATRLLDRLGEHLPADGVVAVPGGAEGEALRPLDFAPRPDGPARRLFAQGVITDELRRLADEQQPDGGWTVSFESASPAAAMEWRGYMTVRAVALLSGEGR